jgi:hypothetical protein
VQVHSFAILPMLLAALLALSLLVGGGWVIWRLARSRPALLIPIALFGLVAIAALLIVGLYSVRLESSEAALRAEKQQELQTLAAALHRHQAAPTAPVASADSASPTAPAATQVLDWRGTSDEQPAENHVDHAADTEEADDPSLELVAFVGRDVVGQRLPNLPDWVHDDPEFHRLVGERREVLVSDQWATLEEADAQLTNLAATKLSEYLAVEHPSAVGWMPDAEAIVQSGAVTRRLHEASTLPIGEFNPSLYRVYWELELTPDVRAELLEAWRPVAVQQRITWLGIGIGVITLVFAALGLILRRGSGTPQQRRAMGPATVVAAVIAAGAATLMLA